MFARWREENATRLKRWIAGQKPIGTFVGRRTALAQLPRPPRLAAGLVVPAQPAARRSLLLVGLLVVLSPLVVIATEEPMAGPITLALIPVLVPLSWLLRSARLVLFAEHLEVQKGQRVLVLPYTLFRGARHVPGDYGDVVLVDPRGLPGVVLREGDRTIATGQAAKLALTGFASSSELSFPDMYGAPSTEIVDVLALLASASAGPTGTETETRTATEGPADDGALADLLGVQRAGPRTVRAPAPLLRFPPRCAICEGTNDLFHTDLTAFHPASVALVLLGIGGVLDRPFVGPTCTACRDAAEARMKKACRRGALAGALVALLCSSPLYLLPLERIVAWLVLPLVVASIGGFIGWCTGYRSGRLVHAWTDWRGRSVNIALPSEAYAEETVVYSSRPRT